MQLKKTVLFALLFTATHCFAQQEYFVYLQTDNKQAFYIRYNNKIYSSTESGYLILSRLTDSALNLVAGFPKNTFPEQSFNFSTRNRDAGFILKNFGDKGWGLFNWQSLQVIMNTNDPAEKKSPALSGTKKSDAFSVMLANAVDDTAVLYTQQPPPVTSMPAAKEDKKTQGPANNTVTSGKDTTIVTGKITDAVSNMPEPIVKMPVLKEDTIKKKIIPPTPAPPKADTIEKKDIVVAKKTDTAYKPITPVPDTFLVSKPLKDALPVNKAAELFTDTSYIAIFIDNNKDTVRVSIPFDNVPVVKTPAPVIPPVAKDTAVVNKPVNDIIPAVAENATDSIKKQTIIPNSNCRETAWDSDIDKLRIKMLAAKNDDDKIALAKKMFQKKCITVKQVNALTELFSSDEGRYKWLDACYAYTEDSFNYQLLETTLKEPYYINRFKAMIRK